MTHTFADMGEMGVYHNRGISKFTLIQNDIYFTAQRESFLAQMQGQNHFPDLKYSPKVLAYFLHLGFVDIYYTCHLTSV